MSKLVVLSGVPGSGKSYFSNMVKEINENKVFIVSSDKLRTLLTGDQQDLSYDKIMWKMFYELPKIYSNDKNCVVILDATATEVKYRVDTNVSLKPYFDEVILVAFDIPKEVIDVQNVDREYKVPQEVVDLYYKNYELPRKEDEEFFDKIYIVNQENFQEIARKI